MTVAMLSAEHDREQWLAERRKGIGASEIAAVMGISPWESPFSLYWRKANGWQVDAEEIMRTGTHLEPAIADWWAAEHPTELVCRAGLYAHPDRPWQLATPDRLVCDPQMHDNPFPEDPTYEYDHDRDAFHLAVLECKWVAHSWDGWGEPGTDQIPVHYRAQVLWQCDVMAVDEWHLAALGPGGFRSYTGTTVGAEDELELMRKAGQEFMDRLAAGDPPPLDSHTATLSTLKRLHPDLTDETVEIDTHLADDYWDACERLKSAQAYKDAVEIRLRAAMGTARRAVWGSGPWHGEKLATRVITDIAESTRVVKAHRRDYLLAPREGKTHD